MRVLVTGATGCVGRAVVAVARSRGWEVRGVARRRPPRPLAAEVEVVAADVRDADAVARAVAGCDAVIHTAGWVHRVPANPAELAEMRSSIVGGTERVAAAAERVGARLVVTSTVAVAGDTDYGAAKLAAEEAARRSCTRTVVIRPVVVFGAHDRGNVIRLIEAVARRRALIVGTGTNRKSMVYSENLADRLVSAAERSDLAGAWIAADDPAPTQATIQIAIAQALGRRPPLHAPLRPLRWLASGLDAVERIGRRRPAGRWRDRIDKLGQETVYPGTALDAALDYRPRVPLDRAIELAVEWWRDRSGDEPSQP